MNGWLVAALVAGGLFLLSRRSSASTSVPSPTPPPPQPPEKDPTEPVGCIVLPQFVQQWATARGINVIFVPWPASELPSWSDVIAQLPGTVEESMPLVVVLGGDGSFWTFSGGMPAPAPAQRDDFCAWLAQLLG